MRTAILIWRAGKLQTQLGCRGRDRRAGLAGRGGTDTLAISGIDLFMWGNVIGDDRDQVPRQLPKSRRKRLARAKVDDRSAPLR